MTSGQVINIMMNKYFNFKCIEVLNLFASGKEPYMNVRHYIFNFIEKYEKENGKIDYCENNYLNAVIENYILDKAKELNDHFESQSKIDKEYFNKHCFDNYKDFIKSIENEIKI